MQTFQFHSIGLTSTTDIVKSNVSFATARGLKSNINSTYHRYVCGYLWGRLWRREVVGRYRQYTKRDNKYLTLCERHMERVIRGRIASHISRHTIEEWGESLKLRNGMGGVTFHVPCRISGGGSNMTHAVL
jgi:hypothetical protein